MSHSEKELISARTVIAQKKYQPLMGSARLAAGAIEMLLEHDRKHVYQPEPSLIFRKPESGGPDISVWPAQAEMPVPPDTDNLTLNGSNASSANAVAAGFCFLTARFCVTLSGEGVLFPGGERRGARSCLDAPVWY